MRTRVRWVHAPVAGMLINHILSGEIFLWTLAHRCVMITDPGARKMRSVAAQTYAKERNSLGSENVSLAIHQELGVFTTVIVAATSVAILNGSGRRDADAYLQIPCD
ncbi:hypothetical protein FGB62_169g224 [Gracilaria domingensis]|nr:hypothetical protein FGB62_169g224 [Gracilaria domingensis]